MLSFSIDILIRINLKVLLQSINELLSMTSDLSTCSSSNVSFNLYPIFPEKMHRYKLQRIVKPEKLIYLLTHIYYFGSWKNVLTFNKCVVLSSGPSSHHIGVFFIGFNFRLRISLLFCLLVVKLSIELNGLLRNFKMLLWRGWLLVYFLWLI